MIHFLWSELSLRKWKQLSKWLLKSSTKRCKAPSFLAFKGAPTFRLDALERTEVGETTS